MSRFLLNLSPYGPNNQIRGFRDSVMLAIYLNRTIILPPWFRHDTDPARNHMKLKAVSKNYHQFEDLMDVQVLANYVNVLPFSALKKICPDGMDVVFFARDPVGVHTWDQLTMYEDISGVPFTRNVSYQDFFKNPRLIAKEIWTLRYGKEHLKKTVRF